ncbi:hypothetical protein ACLB2K_003201 [Fragaria x ananassa]
MSKRVKAVPWHVKAGQSGPLACQGGSKRLRRVKVVKPIKAVRAGKGSQGMSRRPKAGQSGLSRSRRSLGISMRVKAVPWHDKAGQSGHLTCQGGSQWLRLRRVKAAPWHVKAVKAVKAGQSGSLAGHGCPKRVKVAPYEGQDE